MADFEYVDVNGRQIRVRPVSYTHLDVYKRQMQMFFLRREYGITPQR